MAVGHGKLLLFGEHAAVYGFPAVGVQLAETLEVTIGYDKSAMRSELEILNSVPGDGASRIIRALEVAADVVAKHFPECTAEAPGGRPHIIGIGGSLPMSVGFGSSAAFCTGLLRELVRDVKEIDPERLWIAAHRLEHEFHGTPSGIDTALSVYPGASRITPQTSTMPNRTACNLPHAVLVFGAVARERSTASLIRALGELREREPEETMRKITALGEFAADDDTLTDVGTLGARATEAHRILTELGLGSESLQRVVDQLLDAGAVGAKLSGAGGGGAFFGIFAEEELARKATVALKATAGVMVVYQLPVGR